MTHELKTHPEPFRALACGEKTFELRRDDRNFQVGDTLELREFNPETGTYTGRELTRKVSYKLEGGRYDLPDGLCVLGLEVAPDILARNHVRQFGRAFDHWLQILRKERREVHLSHISVDLDHSALFRRLLKGERVYSSPPPLAYSYPWYDLLEESGPQACEFWIGGEGDYLEPNTPVINQSAKWRIEEKRSDTEYIVAFKTLRCRVTHARPGKGFSEWDIEVLDLGEYAEPLASAHHDT